MAKPGGVGAADGVCCDTICDGPWQHCNAQPNAGTCTTLTALAPAASRRGILLTVALLVGVAALALRRALSAARE